jgi:pilus assembly protein CpaD
MTQTTARNTVTFLLAAAALLVAGCAPQNTRELAAQSPKTNDVKLTSLTHPVRFPPGSGILGEAESRDLSAFLASEGEHYGSNIALIEGDSRNVKLSAQRRSSIERVLERQGLKATQVSPAPTPPSETDNVITVKIDRYTVTPPTCPDWSNPRADGFANTPPSNFGCATTTNLALMVANPGDLVRGAPMGGADATFAARGVELYRTGQISKSLHSTGTGSNQSGGGSGNGGAGGGSGNGAVN